MHKEVDLPAPPPTAGHQARAFTGRLIATPEELRAIPLPFFYRMFRRDAHGTRQPRTRLCSSTRTRERLAQELGAIALVVRTIKRRPRKPPPRP